MQTLPTFLGSEPRRFPPALTDRKATIAADETVFRDTAHGLIAWAVATIMMAALVTLGSMTASAVAAAASSAVPAMAPVTPEMAEQARKAAATFSIMTALSMAIGAFVASAAAGLGGFHRDEV